MISLPLRTQTSTYIEQDVRVALVPRVLRSRLFLVLRMKRPCRRYVVQYTQCMCIYKNVKKHILNQCIIQCIRLHNYVQLVCIQLTNNIYVIICIHIYSRSKTASPCRSRPCPSRSTFPHTVRICIVYIYDVYVYHMQ